MKKKNSIFDNFKLIKKLSWEEVFKIWRRNEAWQKSWQEVAKNQGFSSWEEWRKDYAVREGFENKNWGLYKVENPNLFVENLYGGPFKGWIENYYNGKKIARLVNLVKENKMVKENIKVKDILKNFPKETVMTVLLDGKKIIIAEGMHRGAALALKYIEKESLPSDLRIILAKK